MQFKNTPFEYGRITQWLHWLIALLVLFQFYLIYWKKWVLAEDSSVAHFYIGKLHIPLGVLLLALITFSIFWKLYNPHPTFPSHMSKLEKIAAHTAHALLLGATLLMSVSGLIMTTYGGYPPDLFGLYQLPAFLEKNEPLAHSFYEVHEITSFVLLALIVLHTLAAFKHQLLDKDNVVRRMLPWK
jgi:cytochrome b561